MTSTRRRRIVHVVYSFGIGGLENVIVQLINRLPHDSFEHVVMSLTKVGDFKDRIHWSDVQFIELHKAPGHAIPLYPRIWKLFRQLRPDVVHTCNLAALEVVPLAWLAGVKVRIHAEHGWDAHDPRGESIRYQRVRRLYRPFVSHYVAVSADIDRYLEQRIHVPGSARSLIANGVDTDRFCPTSSPVNVPHGCPFFPGHHWLVGTVGRLQTVKNQPLLARAFVRLLELHPQLAERARLVMVGEGPLRKEVEQVLARAGLSHLAWLPGGRDDIPEILRVLDCFVLPSQAEGTSCTLQEAMATALPVIATAVGGTPALLSQGETGWLVPSDDVNALVETLWERFNARDESFLIGRRAREAIVRDHGLQGMVDRYARIMDRRQW